MDLEVGKAYRTLQRAGISLSPISPQMNTEEFLSSYGDLLRKWIENQGIRCDMISLANVRYSNSGQIPETTRIKAAHEYLTKIFETQHQRTPNNLRIRTLLQFNADAVIIDLSNISDSLIRNFLSIHAPQQILNWTAQCKALAIKGNETLAMLFFHGSQDEGQMYASAMIVGYREESSEESAKSKQRREKAEQTAAKRKATLEAKEKALLEKLKAKYEED